MKVRYLFYKNMKTIFFHPLVCCLWASSILLLCGIGVNAAGTNTIGSAAQEQMPTNLQSLSIKERRKFKDSFDTIFTEVDGVLYNSRGVIRDAHLTVNKLIIKEGKNIRYISNNGEETKVQIKEKLLNFGFIDVTEDSIICPVGLIADYFQYKLPLGKSVYVIGPEVMCKELLGRKIHCFGPGQDEMSDTLTENIEKAEMEASKNVGAVIVGFDMHVNYLKILKAFKFLQNKDCLYFIMSPDETFLSSSDSLIPATGAISASITLASGRQPFLLGKPSAHLITVLRTMTNDPQRTLFVGDNLKTDIAMGHRCSFRTVLVLTGIHNLDDVKKYVESSNAEEQMFIPDFYTNAFSDLSLF